MLGCAAINADEALRLNLRLITETDVHGRYLLAKGAAALEQLGANEARRRYNLVRRLYGPSDERVIELKAEVANLPKELSITAMVKQGSTDLPIAPCTPPCCTFTHMLALAPCAATLVAPECRSESTTTPPSNLSAQKRLRQLVCSWAASCERSGRHTDCRS